MSSIIIDGLSIIFKNLTKAKFEFPD